MQVACGKVRRHLEIAVALLTQDVKLVGTGMWALPLSSHEIPRAERDGTPVWWALWPKQGFRDRETSHKDPDG